jgi:hypothetical protein
MTQDLIFGPMGALALLTFIVLGFIPATRFPAVFAGKVTPDDFKLGESPRVPPNVAVTNRNYMNLLELPVLFYIGGLMYYVAGRVTETTLYVAWAYVALRALHSAIHLSYNNVLHRLVAFALSNVVLVTFWILFFIR